MSAVIAQPSKTSFADFIASNYADPQSILAERFADLAEFAAIYGASLDEVPLLETKGYLANLAGKRDQKQGYFCELVRDKDGIFPTVTISSFKGGGSAGKWNPRDALWQRYLAAKDGGSLEAFDAQQRAAHREAAEHFYQVAAERKKARELLDLEGHHRASQVAREIWAAALPCINHAYLEAKKVSSYGLRMAGADTTASLWDAQAGEYVEATAVKKDDLLIPLHNSAGELVGLQRIDQIGSKRFIKGSQKVGTAYRIEGTEPAYIAEGYATAATVHAATGQAVYVGLDAGNLAAVVDSRPGKISAVAADNDEKGAGETGAQATGLPFAMPPTVGQDWNDYAASNGLEAVAAELVKHVKPSPAGGLLRLIDGADLAANAKAPTYLIDEVLEEDAHGIMGGLSMTYKSFMALRMAYSVCTGVEFMGRRVYRTGPVIYVCGEGAPGISRRWKAIQLKLGDIGSGKFFMYGAPLSLNNLESMQLLKECIEQVRPALVIFDTFASLSGGVEENSPTEVGQCLGNVRRVCQAGGASSLIVHHFGKDATKGFRGASNFTNDVDFAYMVNRPDGDQTSRKACMVSHKMKDGDQFAPIHFRASPVPLGLLDQKGQEVYSLVVESDGGAAAESAELIQYGKGWERALEALRICWNTQRDRLADTHPNANPSVTWEDWRLAMVDLGVPNPHRERDKLEAKDLIECLSGKEYRPKT